MLGENKVDTNVEVEDLGEDLEDYDEEEDLDDNVEVDYNHGDSEHEEDDEEYLTVWC